MSAKTLDIKRTIIENYILWHCGSDTELYNYMMSMLDSYLNEHHVDEIAQSVESSEPSAELMEVVHDSLLADIAKGDSTVLFELLKFIPSENLKASLPE